MSALRAQLIARPYTFALALVSALLAVNLLVQPSFGDPGNWTEELATLAPLVLVTMASTPSVLSGGGGLDISVGPLMVVTNVALVTWLIPDGALNSAWIDIPIVLAGGAAVGLLNGLLVAVLRYQPIIATLCTFFVLGGLATTISGSETVVGHNWTSHLAGTVAIVPGALILMAIPALVWLLLARTSYRRNLYAVGANDATAYSAGVNVAAVRVIAYGFGGMFAAVGGIALTALVQSSQADQATAFTVLALAAVALGGTPIGGGRGGMLGSVLGAVAIYLMQELLGAAHVSSSWLQLVYGGMLVVGVVVGASTQVAGRRAAARVVAR
jgi:ribose transport system permease protein